MVTNFGGVGKWSELLFYSRVGTPEGKLAYGRWYNEQAGMSQAMRRKTAQVFQARVEMTCAEAAVYAKKASVADRLRRVQRMRAEMELGK